jgi:hypothetical protein
MVESLILNFLLIKFIDKGNKQKMVYKTNERVFIVNIYLKTKSHKAVCEKFLKQFKREDPSDKYIRELVKACLECEFENIFNN